MTDSLLACVGYNDDTTQFEELTLDDKITVICNTAIRKIQREYPDQCKGYVIERHQGKRWIKLVCAEIYEDGQRRNGSVWAFIDPATQGVYKPASWKAPAKHERYNLDDFQSFYDAARMADWYGSWLYLRH
tara:strand:+ start:2947 stop:3339 length:393 start_codon:yes stop_codon:yes gene_type:complete